jgi:uncharacterized protein YjbI with pentapeptide repeats/MinD-like ATPase involved in chromosome partitioning or flagellar assembly
MEDSITSPHKTEIIAIASGKGGTGKTLVASCLGYALIRGAQRVLMIDGDPATDGLSLFLLGPKGTKQISNFELRNTFTGILSEFQRTGALTFESRTIHRIGPEDHGVSYNAIVSGRGLYGDEESLTRLAVPDLDRSLFRAGLRALFQALRDSNEYDYILVDTRGGFAFESTDVCALADSFIVVTEPDYTSFYQDRNLVRRINQSTQEVSSPSLLRAFIVNKAIEGFQQHGPLDLSKIERSFRLELTKEFPVRIEDTHPIPIDIEALKTYKTQKMIYTAAPDSLFSFSTLSAFSDIIQIVTSRWSGEQVDQWNRLVLQVSTAVGKKNELTQQREQEELSRKNELAQLRLALAAQNERLDLLQRERDRMEKAYERELERSKVVYRPSQTAEEANEKLADREKYNTRRRTFLVIIGMIATVLVSAGGILWNREWRLYRMNDLLTKVYDKNSPPPLRSQYFDQLLSGYHYTKFDAITLDTIDLSGRNLVDISFRSSSLLHANLAKANLSGATLISAQLGGADLSQAILYKASLNGASLPGANLQGSNLASANLSQANLREANLTGANLTGADLTGAILDGAILRGADLTGSRLTFNQVISAIVDQDTRLPANLRGDRFYPKAAH